MIQEREIELQKEHRRQEDNDKLRRDFARQANAFHQWLTETRAAMMETSGTLEEQLELLKKKVSFQRFYITSYCNFLIPSTCRLFRRWLILNVHLSPSFMLTFIRLSLFSFSLECKWMILGECSHLFSLDSYCFYLNRLCLL